MSKNCGRCRRFLSSYEAARCRHCDGYFHMKCVQLPPAGSISPSWQCPGCVKTKTTKKKPETILPERELALPSLDLNVGPLQHSSPTNSTLTSTHELTNDISEELKIFRDNLRSINRDLQIFRDEIADIRQSLKEYHNEVDTLYKRVGTLEKSHSLAGDDGDVISRLRQDLQERDQELLANDVEVANFPEVSGENPVHVAMQIAVKIGVTIDERDIVSADRVGSRRIVATEAAGPEARPRPLVVRLARRDVRDALLQGARTRRGATSADLVPGKPKRFFINERLTKANRQLFHSAREAGQRHGWKFVWVTRGRIFARNKPGDKAFLIRCPADIDMVFNPNTV